MAQNTTNSLEFHSSPAVLEFEIFDTLAKKRRIDEPQFTVAGTTFCLNRTCTHPENTANARFCSACGTRIPVPIILQCPTCGKEATTNADAFCSVHGVKLTAPSSMNASSAASTSSPSSGGLSVMPNVSEQMPATEASEYADYEDYHGNEFFMGLSSFEE